MDRVLEDWLNTIPQKPEFEQDFHIITAVRILIGGTIAKQSFRPRMHLRGQILSKLALIIPTYISKYMTMSDQEVTSLSQEMSNLTF